MEQKYHDIITATDEISKINEEKKENNGDEEGVGDNGNGTDGVIQLKKN